ncbi:hypothetical protein BJ508DRAFT_323194 [Ascobolus immersus RN42]|uniref:Uncharacterized protein n=1 Tax=Ascobolus immersus RN42 TaxID=1160509 RepID=A0A3N4IJY7_ASCIM|nr:hypothetical protein BJ508DRAFT_323194 [Ascobolus immersus RN42]
MVDPALLCRYCLLILNSIWIFLWLEPTAELLVGVAWERKVGMVWDVGVAVELCVGSDDELCLIERRCCSWDIAFVGLIVMLVMVTVEPRKGFSGREWGNL